MSPQTETLEFDIEPTDLRRLSDLCGPFDENLKHIERRLGVEITHRGHNFRLIGPGHTVAAVQNILRDLYVETLIRKSLLSVALSKAVFLNPCYNAANHGSVGLLMICKMCPRLS